MMSKDDECDNSFHRISQEKQIWYHRKQVILLQESGSGNTMEGQKGEIFGRPLIMPVAVVMSLTTFAHIQLILCIKEKLLNKNFSYLIFFILKNVLLLLLPLLLLCACVFFMHLYMLFMHECINIYGTCVVWHVCYGQ